MGFFDKVSESISSASTASKIKAQQGSLKKERGRRLQMIGEEAVGLFQAGSLTQAELRALCEEVMGLDSQIADLEQQLQASKAQLQQATGTGPAAGGAVPPPPGPQAGAPAAPPAPGQAACPQCGSAMSPTAKFCPSCGGKVEAAEAPPAPQGGEAPPPPPPPSGWSEGEK